MAVRPLVGCNHGQGVFVPDGIEVVGLADDGLEIDVGFIDELVPVEVLDGGDVFLAHLDELLLEVALDLADASRFEGGEVVGNDPRAEGGDRIREKGSAVDDVFRAEFFHHNCPPKCQSLGNGQMGFLGS